MFVVAPRAPSQDHTKALWPCSGVQGVEVIRGHNRGEAVVLSYLAPAEKVRRVELLEHRRVPQRARELAPSLHGRLPWLREGHYSRWLRAIGSTATTEARNPHQAAHRVGSGCVEYYKL